MDSKKINTKRYDLEERCFVFAQRTRSFIRILPKTLANIEDGKQVIRSSGSVGANYIEANEALSKKDFLMRIKICRKEAKESNYWFRLIVVEDNRELEKERLFLVQESSELMMIFSAIMRKSE